MIVLDASAVVDFLLALEPRWPWVVERMQTGGSLHAPHLLDLEVASAVRRRTLAGTVGPRRGRKALGDLAELRLTRYPATPLLDRIWQLRASLTVYDASYVALAEALDAPLVTTDRRLARIQGHSARIEAFPG